MTWGLNFTLVLTITLVCLVECKARVPVVNAFNFGSFNPNFARMKIKIRPPTVGNIKKVLKWKL